MTVESWLRSATHALTAAGVESARLEAQVLLAHSIGESRPWLVTHADAVIDPRGADELLRRRVDRYPLAYLLGVREFFGRSFSVSPGVLIPRQDTETLVTAVLELFPDDDPVRILDLGTGSGCVGITLALERPSWIVTLSDVSDDAIRIAAENADSLGVRVTVVRADGVPDGSWDVLISNPPYVRAEEVLEPEVAEHEPWIALYAGKDGLDFYRRLAAEAKVVSWVVVEIGQGQSRAVEDIFDGSGWGLSGQWTDLANIVRVLAFRLS